MTTVGVGLGYNENLMTALAERSDGNHHFVESGADLPRIFAGELGDLLTVAARDVTIRLEMPEGVRPLRIIGRDGRVRRIHSGFLGRGRPDLYAAQLEEQEALVKRLLAEK